MALKRWLTTLVSSIRNISDLWLSYLYTAYMTLHINVSRNVTVKRNISTRWLLYFLHSLIWLFSE